MAYVVRLPGFDYEGGRENKYDCYLCKDGSVGRHPAMARRYDSEAEAWEHAAACGHLGEFADEVRVEEVP